MLKRSSDRWRLKPITFLFEANMNFRINNRKAVWLPLKRKYRGNM